MGDESNFVNHDNQSNWQASMTSSCWYVSPVLTVRFDGANAGRLGFAKCNLHDMEDKEQVGSGRREPDQPRARISDEPRQGEADHPKYR